MSFYRATERTARKRHLCLACHTHVEPGERYLNCAGNSDGDIWFGAYHPDCHAIEIPNCPCGVKMHEMDAGVPDRAFETHGTDVLGRRFTQLWMGSDGQGWSNAGPDCAVLVALRNALPALIAHLEAADALVGPLEFEHGGVLGITDEFRRTRAALADAIGGTKP